MLTSIKFGGSVYVRSLFAISLFAVVAFVGCAPTAGPALRLSPQELPFEKVGVAKDQPVIVSKKFHTVSVSPHSLAAVSGSVSRFYLQIENGSALDVPFNARNVSINVDGNPVKLLNEQQIRLRMIEASNKAARELHQEHQDLLQGGVATGESLSNLGDDELPSTLSIAELQKRQQANDKNLHALQADTRQQLASLDAHMLGDRQLAPGAVYDTFVEFILPKRAHSGDLLDLKVGVEPDVHEFRFLLSDS
jgi:hypothetical protein